MKPLSFFDRLNQWIANSISVKLVSIGILILIMLIPMTNIKSLISERAGRRSDAIQEVSEKWGNEQEIAGLILNIPYTYYYWVKGKEDENQLRSRIEFAHFLPESLIFEGEVKPDTRYRGIYEIVVYQSFFNIKGNFAKPDLSDWDIKDEDIHWEDAFVSLGIPDMRGISENLSIQWNSKSFMFQPGTEIDDLIESGVHSKVKLDPNTEQYQFAFKLDLNGSGRISFVPMGKETTVNLQSSWVNPSFDGAFLPKEREVNDQGFKASWKVLHLNRNFPQKWTDRSYSFSESAFGVQLFLPVDQYQRSYRSAKYALMFITLTFLVFFFVEIINKLRIHPFQYILVGLGLCLFYILLLSLSEHIGFNWAYLLSSSGVVVLIFLYSFSIFKKSMLSFMMFGLLIILYSFLFIILQEQDFSLLIGSVALFFILSFVMYLSRNVNWYHHTEVKPSELNEI